KKTGVPPTPRNARTGELTPPGRSCRARAKRASLWAWFMGARSTASRRPAHVLWSGLSGACHRPDSPCRLLAALGHVLAADLVVEDRRVVVDVRGALARDALLDPG